MVTLGKFKPSLHSLHNFSRLETMEFRNLSTICEDYKQTTSNFTLNVDTTHYNPSHISMTGFTLTVVALVALLNHTKSFGWGNILGFVGSIISKCSAKEKGLDFPQVHWFNRFKLPRIINGCYTITQLGAVGLKLFFECNKKYGKTYQLPIGSLNAIVTTDTEIIQRVLSSNDLLHLNKSAFLSKRLFSETLHGGLLVAPFDTWLFQRKCLSRGFTYKSLSTHLTTINKYSEKLVNEILNSTCDVNKPFQDEDRFAELLRKNLAEFTGDLITGQESYSSQQISQITQCLITHKDCLLYIFRHPVFFLRTIWKWHPMKKSSDEKTNEMKASLKQMIANFQSKLSVASANQQLDAQPQPLLELMLTNCWSEDEILDNVATLTFGETEVIFNGIQFALIHLSLNPKHQAICHAEIDALFASKAINTEMSPATSGTMFLDNADLSQLKYLERCILESLRLSPPIPALNRRLKSPLKINETLEIESGRTIIIVPWVLHRDPDIYPFPNKFDPDRFLMENSRKRPHYAYLPFSAGRRNCIGWKLSIIQMKITLAWLLRHFHVTTDDKIDDIKFFFALRAVPEKNLSLCFKRRHINLK